MLEGKMCQKQKQNKRTDVWNIFFVWNIVLNTSSGYILYADIFYKLLLIYVTCACCMSWCLMAHFYKKIEYLTYDQTCCFSQKIKPFDMKMFIWQITKKIFWTLLGCQQQYSAVPFRIGCVRMGLGLGLTGKQGRAGVSAL